MIEGPPREQLQHNRNRAWLLACAVAAAIASGCGSPPLTRDLLNDIEPGRLEAALVATNAVGSEAALIVRLAFGADADLDLFVSDPGSETVYFANQRARSGGQLVEDLRCDASPPRIETVRFEHPMPGRYRIGVDYPGACSDTPMPAVFVIEWRTRDGSGTARGVAIPMIFDSIAMEFDLEAAPASTESDSR